ncbi:RidA family protein [Tichowtungia aerotolerans]|uniref:RidA family protein n=1 Tax=Tichowtungia aerotolerans TaxID=2697043 RepID=A0A6P1MDB4_9BACT|nr:RidA family protein [Tichowtungia aerotolerans]QHI70058.1 RidA family protein [Tichowtungia aerotolerans]
MKKDIIQTAAAPEPIGPYSQAVESDGTLYCSGQIPVNPQTGDIPETIEEQAHQVLANLRAVIKEAGGDLEDVVKTTIFLTDLNCFAAVNAIYGEYFDEATAPARSTVQVSALPKGVFIEIDAIAKLN